MLNNKSSFQSELGTVPIYDTDNTLKDKNREKFSKGDLGQDKHTGRLSSERKGKLLDKKLPTRMRAEKQKVDDELFTKELIAQGLVEWENKRNGGDSYSSSSLKEVPSFDWRKVWKEIQDTTWEDALEYYDVDMSMEAYEEVQRQMDERQKELEKEARREREIRNFSITGDPKGDKSRTSLVH